MLLFSLEGKKALVTGGNTGIGLGIARGLAKAGAIVAIAGRKPEKNKKALTELHSQTTYGDLYVRADPV